MSVNHDPRDDGEFIDLVKIIINNILNYTSKQRDDKGVIIVVDDEATYKYLEHHQDIEKAFEKQYESLKEGPDFAKTLKICYFLIDDALNKNRYKDRFKAQQLLDLKAYVKSLAPQTWWRRLFSI
jgi:hypothetical protein